MAKRAQVPETEKLRSRADSRSDSVALGNIFTSVRISFFLSAVKDINSTVSQTFHSPTTFIVFTGLYLHTIHNITYLIFLIYIHLFNKYSPSTYNMTDNPLGTETLF